MRSGNFDDDVKRDMKGQVLALQAARAQSHCGDRRRNGVQPRARSARLRVAERTDWMP